MKFFTVFASAVSAIDLTNLMMMQALQQGNNQAGNMNPLLLASMLDKDSDFDPITLMALSGGRKATDQLVFVLNNFCCSCCGELLLVLQQQLFRVARSVAAAAISG